MAKIMVFQHVPYEPLGTLDSLVRSKKHRIRYVNFGRTPNAKPDITGYDALIVLGGPMNIGQETQYPHLDVEKQVITEAFKLDIPVLGICLGAQLIASAFGGSITPAKQREIGWVKLHTTDEALSDPLFRHFSSQEKLFQWHEYTFDIPDAAKLLVTGEQVTNQAFRINHNIYGFQFHLEANLALIQRWLKLPAHQRELGLENAKQRREDIWKETLHLSERSLELSKSVFDEFLKLLPAVKKQYQFNHRTFETYQSHQSVG